MNKKNIDKILSAIDPLNTITPLSDTLNDTVTPLNDTAFKIALKCYGYRILQR